MKKTIVVIGMLGVFFLGGCAGSKDAKTKTRLYNNADVPNNQQKPRLINR